VNSTADPGDGTCNPEECTLREALSTANADGDVSTITFDIGQGGLQTISSTSSLPEITSPVTIDGSTQPGFAGAPIIELNGAGAGSSSNGLRITAGNSVVKSLAINRFGLVGIELAAAGGNRLEGNYIGTDVTGTVDLGNGTDGVRIRASHSNTVGGTAEGSRNVISGNGGAGIQILCCTATNNRIEGNYIGTDASGTADLGNSDDGVWIEGSLSNIVGGTAQGSRNVISGNSQAGVEISFSFVGTSTRGNRVEGNYIGTDASGTADLGNSGDGVYLWGADFNTVGGATAAARNVVSGNGGNGVRIFDGAAGNRVEGNYLGTDASGSADLGNRASGVAIENSTSNTVGGTGAGTRNVISGNGQSGVLIHALTPYNRSSRNRVEGNYIGTDASGTAALGNSGNGVAMLDADSNVVGGTATGAGNLVSGNDRSGVLILGEDATTNRIEGNYIGTNAAGTGDLGNALSGVYIDGAPSNTLGGTAIGARNIISGNDVYGVAIFGSAATGNRLEGNYIGTDRNGTADLSNGYGIFISGAPSNTVGGTTEGARNVISGNGGDGIRILGGGENRIEGNYIGTDATGTADLGNGDTGLYIDSAPFNVVGGTTDGARNVISGNDFLGVAIAGSFAGPAENRIEGNYIGTDVTGTVDLGNAAVGVWIGAPSNVVGGTSERARNVISGNDRDGVEIFGGTGNKIQGNFIGTDATGTADLGNEDSGVLIKAPSNLVGGTTSGARNVISGNRDGLEIVGRGTTGNRIEGNYIGTDVSGTAGLGNSADGVRIDNAPSAGIGGASAAARNVISSNGANGIEIFGSDAAENRIEGNYVGTDATGTADLGNSGSGISISSPSNTVGGTAAGAGNVISANVTGVVLFGSGAIRTKIEGNYIGTDANGSADLGNSASGVQIHSARSNIVGGTAAGAGNVIAGNVTGVSVNSSFFGAAIENVIARNSIFSNGSLGIDLDPFGVTENDPGDPDGGANNLQNFPVVASAASGGGGTTVQGTLNSTPDSRFVLEFFSNSACDASGHGEGERFLGSTTVLTDGSGNANFIVSFPIAVPSGQFVTATATDPSGNTSEFSECRPVRRSSAT
jgi:titin